MAPLALEELELRLHPTAVLRLDFDLGSVFSSLQGRFGRKILDVNHDGRVGGKDEQGMVHLVRKDAQSILAPHVLVTTEGRADFVVKVGVTIAGFGSAPQAGPGFNLAGPGEVGFSNVLLAYRWMGQLKWKPSLLALDIALVTCHEWGHLIGLEHSDESVNDLMQPGFVLGQGVPRWFTASEVQEIVASLQQPTFSMPV